MSFLTPWFLAAGLAIALPIVFHMIRRTPRGRVPFSTLMFLAPSPPRVTRRSQIEHWLLLLLRACAVLLLAAAFARPFLKDTEVFAAEEQEGRLRVLLVDVSGSMQRTGLWDETLAKGAEWIASLGRHDRLAVVEFDLQTRTRLSFAAWELLSDELRIPTALQALRDMQPGWLGTDLGTGLRRAADDLLDQSARHHGFPMEIVLLTDLQSGSRLDPVQLQSWPEEIAVTVLQVGQEAPQDNASVRPLAGGRMDTSTGVLLRVDNDAGSRRDSFQIGWLPEFADVDGSPVALVEPVTVYVPAGQSRVVTLPFPDSLARLRSSARGRVFLQGDAEPFDNLCYVSPPQVRDLKVITVTDRRPGTDLPEPVRFTPEDPEYYLAPAFSATPLRRVNLHFTDREGRRLILQKDGEQTADSPDDLSHKIQDPEGEPTVAEELSTTHLVICTVLPREGFLDDLREYVAQGGTLLLAPRDASEVEAIARILDYPIPPGPPEADVVPAPFVVWTELEFDGPILRPFADPRYSDFSRVHFWRHRTFPGEWLLSARILARFDTGYPALAEVRDATGGPVIVMTSGWWPADSDLARSTKFVPLLNSLLDEASRFGTVVQRFLAGDSLDPRELMGESAATLTCTRPDGTEMPLPEADRLLLDAPGFYVLHDPESGEELSLAVNLDPGESRVQPLDPELLEGLGIRLGGSTLLSREARRQALESSSRRELEARQKLWRWLLIAAVILLLIETWYAGRLSRSHNNSSGELEFAGTEQT